MLLCLAEIGESAGAALARDTQTTGRSPRPRLGPPRACRSRSYAPLKGAPHKSKNQDNSDRVLSQAASAAASG
jgi:hypothetical protein